MLYSRRSYNIGDYWYVLQQRAVKERNRAETIRRLVAELDAARAEIAALQAQVTEWREWGGIQGNTI